jgi:predicted Zn-dependent peptidase
MSRLGKGELVYGEHLSAADLIAKIDAVTADDIAQVANEVLGGPRSLAVIGPVDGQRLTRAVA